MKNLISLFTALTFLFIISCTPKVSEQQEKIKDCITKADPDCICTAHYDPVCGCDGKTYGNSCNARCAGVLSYTEGECGN